MSGEYGLYVVVSHVCIEQKTIRCILYNRYVKQLELQQSVLLRTPNRSISPTFILATSRRSFAEKTRR